MAFPRTDLGVVDPLAAGVTESLLVSFPRFMRFPRALGLAPAAIALAAAASSLFLFTHAPTVRAQCGTASSSPCPTPIPVNAFLSLDVTQGDANTVITVTGGQFLPNEQTTLYWDTPAHVAGSATADQNGSFSNVKVKPFPGDPPGAHRLYASVPPNPFANFTINAPAASPSPSPTPSESPSPSPTAAVTDTPSSSPVAATLNGFDVISRPPFVFLPIAGVIAIGLALGFWLYSVVRRPRRVALTSAAVVHRAMRPDYSAGFGAPPAATAAEPEPSAWEQSPVHAPPTQPSPQPPQPPPASETPTEESQISNVEWGAPVEWGTGSSDWGFPEPEPGPDAGENAPDPPQPAD
jgi:hypothetical protein